MTDEIYVPDHGFVELPDGSRVFPERDADWERERQTEEDYKGIVEMVVYHDDNDEGRVWRPHSIFTADLDPRPRQERQRRVGEYDAQFSERHGSLYVNLAGGGGGPYAHGYVEPSPAPARVWIRPGVRVRDGGAERRFLDDGELLARGYLRIDGPPPSPFAGTLEDKLYWVESAKDWLTYDDTFECQSCREREDHRHRGALLVVFDADDAGIDDPGLYLIKRWPFYTNAMITSWLHEHALQRLGDVPEGVEEDGYYPCGFLCGTCSARVRRGLERRAQPRRTRRDQEVRCG